MDEQHYAHVKRDDLPGRRNRRLPESFRQPLCSFSSVFRHTILRVPVKGRVIEVDIFRVHFFFTELQAFAEPLEVHDLPFPEEADRVVHVRIVGEAEDIVVGQASLLFCRQILREVRNHVAGGLNPARRPRKAGSRRGVDSGGVIHEIGCEGGGVLNVRIAQPPGQLMDNSSDHLQVAQFLGADCGGKRATSEKKPCVERATGRKKERTLCVAQITRHRSQLLL